jgi:hypothetical protein
VTNSVRKILIERNKKMPKKAGLIVIIAVALILSVTTYAFAAANTVDTSGAGDGSATISGYTVTGVTYTLNTADPSKIDTVKFTVTPGTGASSAKSVSIQLVPSGTWYSCTMATNAATCTLPSPYVAASLATSLHVVAAQ